MKEEKSSNLNDLLIGGQTIAISTYNEGFSYYGTIIGIKGPFLALRDVFEEPSGDLEKTLDLRKAINRLEPKDLSHVKKKCQYHCVEGDN